MTLEIGGVLRSTAPEIARGTVQAIYVVRNPVKLGHASAEITPFSVA